MTAHLHSVIASIEEADTADVAQDRVCGVIQHVVSCYWRKRVSLWRTDTWMQLHVSVFNTGSVLKIKTAIHKQSLNKNLNVIPFHLFSIIIILYAIKFQRLSH